MAELADAADSKSAGTWYLGGSTPPPGTSPKPQYLRGFQRRLSGFLRSPLFASFVRCAQICAYPRKTGGKNAGNRVRLRMDVSLRHGNRTVARDASENEDIASSSLAEAC